MAILFVANFLKGSSQDDLDQHFQSIFKWDVPRRFVTRSAISKVRRKLSHGAFIDLQAKVCDLVDQKARVQLYHDMRVFAIDGSTFRLPDHQAVREEFGTTGNQHGSLPMARLSLLHDVLNRMTYDAAIEPYAISENEMAWDHLETCPLPPESLVLLDRGYVDFALMRNIHDLGHHFCIRLRSNLKITKAFNKTGKSDAILWYKPTANVRRDAAKGSSFGKSFRVRVVRQKIAGTWYTLMTTLLDRKQVPRHELFDLYHQRWEIEESFKVKKCRLKIEEISGTTPEIIRQDFYAKVFAECLTVALMLDLRPEVEAYSLTTINEYKISITQALAKMKNTLVLLFIRKNPVRLLRDLHCIFMKSLVGVSPGRVYARKTNIGCPASITLSLQRQL